MIQCIQPNNCRTLCLAAALQDGVPVSEVSGTDQVHAGVGQIVYAAIAANEPPGRALREVRRLPVRLTLMTPEELFIRQRRGLAGVREGRILRLATEAYTQGALLTVEDLSLLLTTSTATIKRDLAALRGRGLIVPTRGYIKDIGPGVSYKTQIVELYVRGLPTAAIEQRAFHPAESIQQFVRDFIHVIRIHLAGARPEAIQQAAGVSRQIIAEYVQLYQLLLREVPTPPRLHEIRAAMAAPEHHHNQPPTGT